MIFNFSFEDFQKMLTENNAKPIYEVSENGYKMYWTIGGFIYMTSLSFGEILASYRRDRGDISATLEKAIGVFKETYLKDSYEHRPKLGVQSVETIGEQQPSVRVESKTSSTWAFKNIAGSEKIIPKTMWMEDDPKTGNKLIKGVNTSDAVTIVGMLERSKQAEQNVFKPKSKVVRDERVVSSKIDTTPPQKTATMEKEVPKTDSKKLKEMLKSG